MYDIPVEVFQIDVVDAAGNNTITTRNAFSYGKVEDPIYLGDELQKYAALYREGLSSRNELYSYLCFYKIIEAVERQNTIEGAKAAKSGTPPTKRAQHRLPKDDATIASWAKQMFPGWYKWSHFSIGSISPKEARGVKLGSVRESFLRPLRDSIAHGLLDDVGIIDVDDPDLHGRVRYWLPYLRSMARRVSLARCFPTLFDDREDQR
jgi:hypothetical protein